MEDACNFCPAMAVPITVKIPEPITAPIPSDVRLNQPSDFFNRRSGSSASEISWSMFLTRNSPEPTRHHPPAIRIEERGNCTLRGRSPQLSPRFSAVFSSEGVSPRGAEVKEIEEV